QAGARLKPIPLTFRQEPVYPQATAGSPDEAAAELIELFDFLDDWGDRYNQIIEMGEKLLPMPAAMKTPENRVHGCQSTVFISARKKPGSANRLEFLADSDADIVRGLVAILQKVYSGQPADKVVAFDVNAFMGRLGLDKHLSMGRRNGLGEMIQRVRKFAAGL